MLLDTSETTAHRLLTRSVVNSLINLFLFPSPYDNSTMSKTVCIDRRSYEPPARAFTCTHVKTYRADFYACKNIFPSNSAKVILVIPVDTKTTILIFQLIIRASVSYKFYLQVKKLISTNNLYILKSQLSQKKVNLRHFARSCSACITQYAKLASASLTK